jgi:hypothetical protein
MLVSLANHKSGLREWLGPNDVQRFSNLIDQLASPKLSDKTTPTPAPESGPLLTNSNSPHSYHFPSQDPLAFQDLVRPPPTCRDEAAHRKVPQRRSPHLRNFRVSSWMYQIETHTDARCSHRQAGPAPLDRCRPLFAHPGAASRRFHY